MIVQKDWLETLGFRSMGWHDYDTALHIVNEYPAVIYSFGLFPFTPASDLLPYDTRFTKYTGMSGGTLSGYRFDQKSKNGKGQIKYPGLDRFHSHRKFLFCEDEEKISVFSEKYQRWHQEWKVGLTPWFNLITMDINTPREVTSKLRPTLMMIESMMIYLYAENFNDAPKMNLSHTWDITYRKNNSISNGVVNEHKNRTTLETVGLLR